MGEKIERFQARLIRDAREQQGMTDSELARALGAKPQTLWKWKGGYPIADPHVVRLAQLAGRSPEATLVRAKSLRADPQSPEYETWKTISRVVAIAERVSRLFKR